MRPEGRIKSCRKGTGIAQLGVQFWVELPNLISLSNNPLDRPAIADMARELSGHSLPLVRKQRRESEPDDFRRFQTPH